MSIYDLSVISASGETVPLSQYQENVLLIVNTASKCGFTPQYKGLEALYQEYADRGLVVLGFPCNQFGKQEPGSNNEINAFCELNYGVTFPLFAKLEVNGENADPLFRFLKSKAPGVLGSTSIKWNFTKFLVGRQGGVIKRFAPTAKPESLLGSIEMLL